MMDRVFRAALFACALVGIGVFPAAADDGGAAGLLAKHRAYVGWAGGDGTVKTVRASGEARRGDTVVSTFEELRLGVIYRRSGSTRLGSYEDGFTGRVFWQSNENGFTVQTVGETVKYLVSRIALANEFVSALPGSVRREETVNGVRTSVVRVVPESGLPIDLSIDPQTGALRRYVIDPDGKYETRVDVLDYTDLGEGKRVVSSWRYSGGKTVYRWTKVELNKDVTAEELHPPKQTATWTFGPQTETVPLEVTEKRIFVDALVNGHKGRFILDTGADGIAFTDTFARAAGAKRFGETRIRGIGGGARANVYHVDSITLGSSVLSNVVVMTGLDESIEHSEHYDGLIGFDLLAGAIVDLNLDQSTM
ncbi:MAG TPA: retropepsin-like aspartic protease, partial [Candidatus Acidoferrum sp.]|nr:retropepsin-like aspartic protease [Candidatus Acidoferrum sp.]